VGALVAFTLALRHDRSPPSTGPPTGDAEPQPGVPELV
jgi:hypothetical protein